MGKINYYLSTTVNCKLSTYFLDACLINDKSANITFDLIYSVLSGVNSQQLMDSAIYSYPFAVCSHFHGDQHPHADLLQWQVLLHTRVRPGINNPKEKILFQPNLLSGYLVHNQQHKIWCTHKLCLLQYFTVNAHLIVSPLVVYGRYNIHVTVNAHLIVSPLVVYRRYHIHVTVNAHLIVSPLVVYRRYHIHVTVNAHLIVSPLVVYGRYNIHVTVNAHLIVSPLVVYWRYHIHVTVNTHLIVSPLVVYRRYHIHVTVNAHLIVSPLVVYMRYHIHVTVNAHLIVSPLVVYWRYHIHVTVNAHLIVSPLVVYRRYHIHVTVNAHLIVSPLVVYRRYHIHVTVNAHLIVSPLVVYRRYHIHALSQPCKKTCFWLLHSKLPFGSCWNLPFILSSKLVCICSHLNAKGHFCWQRSAKPASNLENPWTITKTLNFGMLLSIHSLTLAVKLNLLWDYAMGE